MIEEDESLDQGCMYACLVRMLKCFSLSTVRISSSNFGFSMPQSSGRFWDYEPTSVDIAISHVLTRRQSVLLQAASPCSVHYRLLKSSSMCLTFASSFLFRSPLVPSNSPDLQMTWRPLKGFAQEPRHCTTGDWDRDESVINGGRQV